MNTEVQDRCKIFTSIFVEKKWDREPNEDKFSGLGSRPENTAMYEDFVVDLCERFNIRSVVDIGCGDFQVARRWLPRVVNVRYLGCDIVSEMIESHQRRHATELINFRQLDAVVDDIPAGDLILVREVLQHLSNSSINKIIPKVVGACRIALITECVRRRAKEFNVDIEEGRQTRVGKRSGVFLERPPFNINGELVLNLRHAFSRKKRLRTVLIQGAMSKPSDIGPVDPS